MSLPTSLTKSARPPFRIIRQMEMVAQDLGSLIAQADNCLELVQLVKTRDLIWAALSTLKG